MYFAKIELNTKEVTFCELRFYVKIIRPFKNPAKLPGINTEDLIVSFSEIEKIHPTYRKRNTMLFERNLFKID